MPDRRSLSTCSASKTAISLNIGAGRSRRRLPISQDARRWIVPPRSLREKTEANRLGADVQGDSYGLTALRSHRKVYRRHSLRAALITDRGWNCPP
jgi:hypothetical protein